MTQINRLFSTVQLLCAIYWIRGIHWRNLCKHILLEDTVSCWHSSEAKGAQFSQLGEIRLKETMKKQQNSWSLLILGSLFPHHTGKSK